MLIYLGKTRKVTRGHTDEQVPPVANDELIQSVEHQLPPRQGASGS